jgi:hypothetical protein
MDTLLHGLVDLVTSHPALTLTLVLAWWIFSAVVRSMPLPEPSDNRRYRFLFAFCHSLRDSASGSLARVLASRSKPPEQPPTTEPQAIVKSD